MLKFCLAILFFIITLVSSAKFRFDNYSLYNVIPKNEKDLKFLQELSRNNIEYDFWNEPVPSAEYVNIMTSPLQKNALEAYLNLYGIDYKVAMKNIQE